ncbi:MAG: hypothetical protein IJS08_13875 [Victivallales bacterium]|nr:hypothetical protein [Victivallales bacterium]
MLKDTGFIATVKVGKALSSGGTAKVAVTELGLPDCAGGTMQVTPISGISNLTVAPQVISGTAYLVGTATGSVTSGASGKYFCQVMPDGAKVTLT